MCARGTGVQCVLGKGWSRQCPASRFPGENLGEVHTGGLGCPLFRAQAQDPETGSVARRPHSTPSPSQLPPPRPRAGSAPTPGLRRAPHPAAPAGASGGSARPSWGPAPSGWTSSHPRGSSGRTSRRGKPGPAAGAGGAGAARVTAQGPARRVSRGPLGRPSPCRRRCRFSCDSRKEGRAARAPRGEGQEGGVNKGPTAPPRGRRQPPLGRSARARGRDSSQGATWSAPSHKETNPMFSLYYKSRDAPR